MATAPKDANRAICSSPIPARAKANTAVTTMAALVADFRAKSSGSTTCERSQLRTDLREHRGPILRALR